ncbi:MBL fold metallo-hydrolase [Nonomuraea sp. CA-218870]|uniref:MBL fold metallo-hydrolase n=1 Tax=Nonomuraea sp. CA-218870 TaxID=3239998 RepID=UPI003D94A716
MPATGRGSLLFIGNATTLIRYNGFNLLTDPNFLHRGQRAYLGYGLTSKRLTEPALSIDELPPLDAVVLSHLHGDHWDRVTRRHLDRDTQIVTTRHAASRLSRQGFSRSVGVSTWQQHELRGPGGSVTITALPARHAPGPVETLLPPVMGSMLEFYGSDGLPDLRLLISGDTIMDRRLEAIPRRFPDIDLAVIHLGGTKLLGMTVTLDGEQGARYAELVDATSMLPVHFDDYAAFASPLSDFKDEMERWGLADRVIYLERGQSCDLTGRRSPI